MLYMPKFAVFLSFPYLVRSLIKSIYLLNQYECLFWDLFYFLLSLLHLLPERMFLLVLLYALFIFDFYLLVFAVMNCLIKFSTVVNCVIFRSL